MTRPIPPFDRVMRRTERQGDCLVFTGPRNNRDYGYVGVGHTGKVLAHRAVWEHHYGPIPAGMVICHACDNPPCVNVDHLWIGTQKTNAADMVAKGRHVNPQAIKTHCDAGHPFDEKNTRVYVYPDGRGVGRICRECQRLTSAKWRAKNR